MKDRALLELIYRSRPRTVAELATAAHTDEAEVTDAVARLAEGGAISVRAGAIGYAKPATWTADVIEREVRAIRQTTEDAASRIESVVADLPALLRHWAVGEASGDLVPVFVRHGPQAAEDLWYDIAREHSDTAWSVLPDLGRYLQTDPARSSRFAEMFAGKTSVRALLPRSMADDPGSWRSPSATRPSGWSSGFSTSFRVGSGSTATCSHCRSNGARDGRPAWSVCAARLSRSLPEPCTASSGIARSRSVVCSSRGRRFSC